MSTDQGVAFRMMYRDAPVHLDFTTADKKGTNDWTVVTRVFDAPAGGGLVWVNLVRRPSLTCSSTI
jgi:hypothetical protein